MLVAAAAEFRRMHCQDTFATCPSQRTQALVSIQQAAFYSTSTSLSCKRATAHAADLRDANECRMTRHQVLWQEILSSLSHKANAKINLITACVSRDE
jgi:hypothetical protein